MLVGALAAGEDVAAVLHHVIVGVAREQAARAFEKKQLDRRAADTSRLSSRRLAALCTLKDLVLLERRHGPGLDPRGTQFQAVAKYFLQLVVQAAAPLPEESREHFLAAVGVKFADWEHQADVILRQRS